MRLLTIAGNPKTDKSISHNYWTAILHLSPANEGRVFVGEKLMNTCPHSTAGCRAACLHTAGRGGRFPEIPAARARKTELFFKDREMFMLQISYEITCLARRAKNHGLKPCVRLNGTSDIQWEKILLNDKSLMDWHPDVQFYDYTKHPGRYDLPKNYSLTYSLAEGREVQACAALARGRNVAVVFHLAKDQPLPKTHMIGHKTFKVFNGDTTDLRFLDPKNVIVGLYAKGRAKHDKSGFVRNVN